MWLWLFVPLLSLGTAYDFDIYEDGWSCFGEGPKVVKYTDTGNIVPGLDPYVALHGGWDSMHVTNIVVKIIMKEKMGVDLLICSDDHPIQDDVKCYDSWPVGLHDSLEDGRMDVILENWASELELANHQQRVFEKRVLDLGPTGVMGFETHITSFSKGWSLGNFERLLDADMQATLLSDGTALWNLFKDRTGKFKMYSSAWTQSAQTNEDYPDLEVGASWTPSKPIFWTIGWNWASTLFTRDLTHNYGVSGLYHLVAIKDEMTAIEIFEKADELGLHYITYTWDPGYLFGGSQKQLVTGKYRQDSECEGTANCDKAVQVLVKAAANTIYRVPEVGEFLYRFRFETTADVTAVIYNKIKNQKSWRDAACDYLKSTIYWEKFVLPIERVENQDPWWKIYVEIGAILCACIFLGTLIIVAWRQLSGESAGEMVQEEKLKKEAGIDMMMMAGVIAFDIIDVICSSWATATCFEIAGDNVLLVIGFCVALVGEIACGIFVSLQRITVIKELRAKYNGTWQNEEGGADLKSAKMHSKTEALMFIAGLGEDLPWLVLYVIVMVMGYLEPAFVAGAGMSFSGFGYKLSSLEKHFLYKKMEGYTAQLLKDVEVKSKDN